MKTGQLVYTQAQAHKSAVNAMALHLDYMLITGDDDGVVKLWDLRTKTAACEWHDNEEYISDICVSPDNKLALATGYAHYK
jgi:WD40 repeat protein